jgi:hypothetical protein
MSRMVSRARIAPVAAVLLGLVVLGLHEAFQPTQVSMWLVEAGSGHDTGSVLG